MFMNRNKKISVRFIAILLFLLTFTGTALYAQEKVLRTVRADEFFSALEQERLTGKGILLDVRTPDEYSAGHAPSSENIVFYADDFQNDISKLDRDDVYFLYCRSGNRSGRTLKLMENLGFNYVYDLSGGWSRNASRLLAVEESSGTE